MFKLKIQIELREEIDAQTEVYLLEDYFNKEYFLSAEMCPKFQTNDRM